MKALHRYSGGVMLTASTGQSTRLISLDVAAGSVGDAMVLAVQAAGSENLADVIWPPEVVEIRRREKVYFQ